MPIISQASHGGYVPPVDREDMYGPTLGINNGAADFLHWARSSGTVLLDLTDPTQPTIVAAGVYAVSVTVQATAPLTAGGSFQAELDLDANGTTSKAVATSHSNTPNASSIALAATSYLPAGAVVFIYVNNFDGANAINFSIAYATVQRLT